MPGTQLPPRGEASSTAVTVEARQAPPRAPAPVGRHALLPELFAAPARPALAGSPQPADRTDTTPVALQRGRLRGVPAMDIVEFVARCPGCGRDARWQEEREDTRLRATVSCSC